jgi:hypothetical protein
MAAENTSTADYQQGSGSYMDPDLGVKVRGSTGAYKTFRPANCSTLYQPQRYLQTVLTLPQQ